ncbi:hypothetical protein CK203_024797 [Vitis vinifera]|uniref:Uncharacterized protein n=1 Tax=Vitis vinifera TaxID=29760 RepID=A0A438ITH3_VITVI|nr:hypothetical protein CK203_024797 [Vitis vinifera]
MSAPLLLRAVPLLRLRHHRLAAPLLTFARRPWCCSTESSRSDVNVSYADKNTTVLSSRDPANYPRWDDPDFRKWKIEKKRSSETLNPSLRSPKRFSTRTGTSLIAITPNMQASCAFCLANEKFEDKESLF